MTCPGRLMVVVALLAVCVPARLAGQDSAAAPTMALHVAGQLPERLALHGSAVVGGRLYVFGGHKPTQWNKQAWSAELQAGGNLGSWRDEPELPQYVTHIGPLVEVFNDRIYIMGGLRVASENLKDTAINTAKDVIWTKVGADGKLEPWKQSEPVEKPLANGASCATQTHVFMVGGKHLGAITNAITVGELSADGAPIRWHDAGALPVPLHFHGATIQDGRMIVWGGLLTEATDNVNPNIYSAPVGKDGGIGPWEIVGTMPTPLYRSGYLGFNDYLMCVGGLGADGNSVNAIWHSVLAGGKPAGWQVVGTDLAGTIYVSVTVDRERGWVIASGGRYATSAQKAPAVNAVDAVQVFRAPQAAEQRLVVTSQSGASATAGSGPANFMKMSEALQAAAAQKKSILVFFYSPEVPSCKRVWSEVVSSAAFRQATAGLLLAAVDVTGPDNSYSYKYGTFRVPSFVLVGPDGARPQSAIGATTMEEIKELLGRK